MLLADDSIRDDDDSYDDLDMAAPLAVILGDRTIGDTLNELRTEDEG